jgi:hypothetical protein
MTCKLWPRFRAAALASSICLSASVPCGFTSSATSITPGTICRRISMRFAIRAAPMKVAPAMFHLAYLPIIYRQINALVLGFATRPTEHWRPERQHRPRRPSCDFHRLSTLPWSLLFEATRCVSNIENTSHCATVSSDRIPPALTQFPKRLPKSLREIWQAADLSLHASISHHSLVHDRKAH